MTLAEKYNAEVERLMPHLVSDLTVDSVLTVDPVIDDASHIDELVFHRSEYLGGMAAVILAVVKQKEAGE